MTLAGQALEVAASVQSILGRGDGLVVRRATALSKPCSPSDTSASTRSDAAPARSSLGLDSVAEQSLTHAAMRCPHSSSRTETSRTVWGELRIHTASVQEPAVRHSF